MNSKFISTAIDQLIEIDRTQTNAIDTAAEIICNTLLNKGIIQIFGSGHSIATALEVVERAGGLFATKVIRDPAMGIYESVSGVGEVLMRKVDIRPEDTVIVVSHSGINPLPIDVALDAKKKGAKLVGITSISASSNLKSRHHSGQKLFEIVDVCIDTLTPDGDAALRIGDMKEKICPTSSMASVAIVQSIIYSVVEKMYNKGIACDIRISSNTEGGLENNISKHHKYADRIYRI
jgi:uncharacterized phosphosugar-binding protein